jgi:ABC-type sulfate/molybdate transport systems ATPase subunit
VQQASLFLLDEPLNAVDESTRDIVDQVLSDHARVGGSVLVATHDLGRLSESFDLAVYLESGRIECVEQLPGGRAIRIPTSQLAPQATAEASPASARVLQGEQ